MKFLFILLALIGTTVGKPGDGSWKSGASGSIGVGGNIGADGGGMMGAGGGANLGISGNANIEPGCNCDCGNGGGNFGGNLGGNLGVSGGGYMGAGGGGNLGVGGGGNLGVGGGGNLGVSGGGSLDGNLGFDGCMQGGISGGASIGGNGQLGGEGGISASGQASLNWPGKGCGNPPETTAVQSGYSYKLNVSRDLTMAPSNDVVKTEYVTLPSQDIEYFERVDMDSPFFIDGELSKDKKTVLKIDRKEPLNSCKDYEDGSWNDLVVKIIDTQLMPDKKCPVEKGTYKIQRNTDVFFTFEEKPDCGKYSLLVDIDNGRKQWAFKLSWDFEIPDDGNCNP